MYIPKYFTTTKISTLQKLCKKYNIKIKKNINKNDIIKKLNRFLLKSLTKVELIYIYNDLTNNLTNNIIKNNTKKQLINKLLYQIKSKLTTNLISNYFYNKYNIKPKNYGAFGITCEYVLCKIFQLDIMEHNAIDSSYINILMKSLYKLKYEFKSLYNMKCIKYLGNINHKVDFLCKSITNNHQYTLSVKSNINSKHLVCPQILGQCTYNSFIKYIKQIKNITISNIFQLKRFISKNLLFLFNTYYKYLFSCDYLLWIKKQDNIIDYKILSSKRFTNLDSKSFKLTQTLHKWKSSNSLKYKNKTIGIFQLHNKKNVIQFRFYLDNLLKL